MTHSRSIWKTWVVVSGLTTGLVLLAGGCGEPKAEQDRKILSQLRQLYFSAEQFYLENNQTTVTCDQLVGPDKYVKMIVPIEGENYAALEFHQGQPLQIRTLDGRVFAFAQVPDKRNLCRYTITAPDGRILFSLEEN